MSLRFRRSRGRFFPTRYDTRRMDKDMQAYQEQFGVEILWYFFNSDATVINPVYDERDGVGGGKYRGPVRIPVISAQRIMGSERPNEEGQFTLDQIVVEMSYAQAVKAGIAPAGATEIAYDTTTHTLDRFVYEHRVFDVTEIRASGQYDPTHRYLTLSVTATQLRPDELVFDPSFKAYSA